MAGLVPILHNANSQLPAGGIKSVAAVSQTHWTATQPRRQAGTRKGARINSY